VTRLGPDPRLRTLHPFVDGYLHGRLGQLRLADVRDAVLLQQASLWPEWPDEPSASPYAARDRYEKINRLLITSLNRTIVVPDNSRKVQRYLRDDELMLWDRIFWRQWPPGTADEIRANLDGRMDQLRECVPNVPPDNGGGGPRVPEHQPV
jgi:hypothetical protein